jgi:hypothetical protein
VSNTNDGPTIPPHIAANYRTRIDAGESAESIATTTGGDPDIAALLRSFAPEPAPKGRKTARSETA